MNKRIETARAGYLRKFGAFTNSSDWTIENDKVCLNGRKMRDDGEPQNEFEYRIFAAEHNLSIESVREFDRIAAIYRKFEENAMNGAAHPRAKDKSEAGEIWSKQAETIAKQLDSIAIAWGFHHCDFGGGLFPTLQKTNSDTSGTIHFPYSCD